MRNKGMQFGAVFAVMLLMSMAFVPAVSGQIEESKTIQEPSELEQGLIDALTSQKEGTSTEDIINKYIKSNKNHIKLKKNTVKENMVKSESRTYDLGNGLQITFNDDDLFYVTEVIEETITTESTSTVGIQAYTSTITTSYTQYSWIGLQCFTLYTKGYFYYDNHNDVEAYHIDSWYTTGLSIWQVSNWEEGAYNHAGGSYSEFYGRGNFHFGIEYDGIGLVIQDVYVNLYVSCDPQGFTQTHVTIT